MAELIILFLLVWVPVLLYEMSRRSFVFVLAWLFIAPVALNVVDRLGGTTFVEPGARQDATSGGSRYSSSEASIKAGDLLNPTRLLFAGLLVVFMVEAALKRRRIGRFDTTEKCAFIFSLIVLASALFRANRTGFALRIASDAFIIPFVAYLCARRLVITEDRLQQVMKVIGYMGFYVLLLCAVERLLHRGGELYYRVGGPFNDPNVVHVVMSVTFLIALIDLLVGWQGKTRLFPDFIRNCILFVAPVVVLFTWARATWLAFLCSITAFILLNRRFLPRSVTILAVGVAFTVIPLIIASFATTSLDQMLHDRVTQRMRTIYSRFGAWNIALQEYANAPIFGVGLMNLRETLHSTRVVVAEGVRSEANPHNSFITILTEQGTFGLVAYLGIVISIFQMGRRLYKERRTFGESVCGALVIAIMAAYLVPGLFTNVLHGPRLHHLYVYTLMGAIAGIYGRRPYSRRAVTPTDTSRLQGSLGGERVVPLGAS